MARSLLLSGRGSLLPRGPGARSGTGRLYLEQAKLQSNRSPPPDGGGGGGRRDELIGTVVREVLSGVVHEANNCLGVILCHAELGLLEEGLSDQMSATLEAICRANARCQRLLELIRNVGGEDPQESFVLEEVLRGVRDLSQKHLGHGGLRLELPVSEEGHETWVKGSGSRLSLCLLALLVALVVEMREQGIQASLQIEYRTLDGHPWLRGSFTQRTPEEALFLPQGPLSDFAREIAAGEGWDLRVNPQGFRIRLS